MWPKFDSRTWRHIWVEFVVGSHLFPKEFFPWYSSFPLSSKTNIFSKFHSDVDTVDEEPPRGGATANSYYYFIYYLFYAANQIMATRCVKFTEKITFCQQLYNAM